MAKRYRVTLECQECHKRWRVSPNAADPECPRCNAVDFEVDDRATLASVAAGHTTTTTNKDRS